MYNKHLPNNSYQLKKCNNGQWPGVCKTWAVYADGFKAADFVISTSWYPINAVSSLMVRR